MYYKNIDIEIPIHTKRNFVERYTWHPTTFYVLILNQFQLAATALQNHYWLSIERT